MIYLDACLVIYLTEHHARWGEIVAGAIAQAEGARFAISPLHLACAQHHQCAALWTNDDRLAQAAHGLARNVLK